MRQRELVQEELNRLVEQGKIRLSTSRFSSPAFPITKKTGGIRLVIDYRSLNNVTVKKGQPFPSIWEKIYELNNKKVFSQIDLNSGYHHIDMNPKDIEKTAFSILNQHFEFTRMPFGLADAPKTFVKAMNYVFKGINNVYVFIDDILIASENIEEHLKDVAEVLLRCKKHDLTINFEKPSWYKDKVDYLGFEITEKGIEISEKGLKSLDEIKPPKTKKTFRKYWAFLTGSEYLLQIYQLC